MNRSSRFITAVLIIAFVLTGCARQGAVVPKPENKDVMDIFNARVQTLLDNGIFFVSAGEQDGVVDVTIFGADQGAVKKVREIMGDLDIVVWDAEESFFIKGEITEVWGPDEKTRSLGGIKVNAAAGDAGQIESAYLSVVEPTRILRRMRIYKNSDIEGNQALTAADLQVGQKVEVWVMGAVLHSLPPQAMASKIIITE